VSGRAERQRPPGNDGTQKKSLRELPNASSFMISLPGTEQRKLKNHEIRTYAFISNFGHFPAADNMLQQRSVIALKFGIS